MIDWVETEKQCGVTEITATKMSRVVVECDSCYQNRIISYHGYKRLIREQSNSLCTSCRNKQNREKYSDNYKKSDRQRSVALSRTMKEKWGKDEYREKMVSSIHISKDKHSVASKKLWRNSEYRTKVTGSVKELYNDPKYCERMDQIYSSSEYKQKLGDNWKKPEYREKVLVRWSDPICKANFAAACSERSKLLWQDENYRSKVISSIKEKWNDNDYRNQAIILSRKVWDNKVLRENASLISKRLWNNPEYQKLTLSSLRATSKKIAATSKTRWMDVEYRTKMLLFLAELRINMPRISSLQIRLYELLEMFGVKFYKEGRETVVGPYTFDCLVPKQGSMLKDLLIECHGEYFHSRPNTISRDKGKLTYINEYFPGFEVRVLWEQWFCFRGKVEAQVREWLGLVEPIEQVDFSFKDVVIGSPSYKDSVEFLSKYHYLYTCPRGSLYYGAYLNDELVAVCLLSPPIRQNIASSIKKGLKSSDVLELSRFCIHPKFHKRNFASWFLARVLCSQDKVIFSYSDSTVGHDGGIYKAAGFVMDRVVDPDYWYVDGEGWVVHKRTLYGRAVRMSLTEREYAEKHGFRKVFGGVKYRFVWGL